MESSPPPPFLAPIPALPNQLSNGPGVGERVSQRRFFNLRRNSNALEPRNPKAFRSNHPHRRNWLVTAQTLPPFAREIGGMNVICVGIEIFRGVLGADGV